jgi:cysteine-rich repeat protein
VAGDALGLRREIWLSIEGAHAGTDLWLATSVRTTAPIDDPSPGLSTVLSGTLDRCDAFQIDGARFSRIATGFCGDGRRRDGESCDDGNMASGDGCSASCAPERTRGRTTLPRLGDR